jgi:hypothetical protein
MFMAANSGASKSPTKRGGGCWGRPAFLLSPHIPTERLRCSGKWILTNVLGTPPTPPPPNVPELKDNSENAAPKSLRERMEAHRADVVCAGCHKVMDPIGFSLENFDAIGRWRAADDGVRIDPSGTLFTGAKIDGADTIVQFVVDHGARLDVKTKRQFTPLDVAIGKSIVGQLPVPHDRTVALIRKLGGLEGADLKQAVAKKD